MADPTLRDLLDSLTTLRTELTAKIDAHRAETARGFAEVHKTLAELDTELARGADPTHRELEERVSALERTARKPAARTAARPTRRR